MTKFKKWFRRQYKRLKVKLHIWERGTSWFKPPQDSTGYENITTAIVRKMINHPLSEVIFTIRDNPSNITCFNSMNTKTFAQSECCVEP